MGTRLHRHFGPACDPVWIAADQLNNHEIKTVTYSGAANLVGPAARKFGASHHLCGNVGCTQARAEAPERQVRNPGHRCCQHSAFQRYISEGEHRAYFLTDSTDFFLGTFVQCVNPRQFTSVE